MEFTDFMLWKLAIMMAIAFVIGLLGGFKAKK